MKHQALIMISTLLFIAAGGHAMNEDSLLMNHLPGSHENLQVESEEVIEKKEDFYRYINGGAELYLNYGFKKLAKRNYLFGGSHQLKAEIFDMGSPANAFGVFSYSRDTVNIDVGQGAQYMGGSLIFWQDRYFVSIFAHQENQEVRRQLNQMARYISNAIGGRGQLPGIFDAIPQESLVPASTFYFHHHAWQNRYRYISNANIFNIDENVHAVLNKYKAGRQPHYLMMVEYPDEKKARKAYKKATGKLVPQLRKEKAVQDQEGLWMGCERKGRLLLFVLDAPGREETFSLINRADEKYRQIK